MPSTFELGEMRGGVIAGWAWGSSAGQEKRTLRCRRDDCWNLSLLLASMNPTAYLSPGHCRELLLQLPTHPRSSEHAGGGSWWRQP